MKAAHHENARKMSNVDKRMTEKRIAFCQKKITDWYIVKSYAVRISSFASDARNNMKK